MNEEIKQRALELLEKQCPDELEIYNRWERCVEMYAKGFRSVPQPMSELIEWFNPESVAAHIDRIAVLGVCLHFVNVAMESGCLQEMGRQYHKEHLRATVLYICRIAL